jgi:hypothetical protein
VATIIISGISFAAFTVGIALTLAAHDPAGDAARLAAALVAGGIFALALCVLMQALCARSTSRAALDRIRRVEERLQNDRQWALLASSAPPAALNAGRYDAGFTRASNRA